MIQINLLPPEYRPRTGTPVARFAAIVVGVIMVASASGAYAYTHFIELKKVEELRQARDEERRAKEMQRDRSLALQNEIDIYEKRREAIQMINGTRTLWSRKLDQFFDIVTAQHTEHSYIVWVDKVEVPVQLAATRRARRPSRGQASELPAAEFDFEARLAMNDDAEALALSSTFHKALTGDPENTGRATDFFADFQSVSNPGITMEDTSREEDLKLVPPLVGSFEYSLRLKPIDVKSLKKTRGRK